MTSQPHQQPALARLTLTGATLIIGLGFCAGLMLGRINPASVIQSTKDAYVNRYLSMSESGRQQITYYFYTSQPETALPAVENIAGVRNVSPSGPHQLYDVVLEYSQRRQTVKAIRQLPEVSIVFTVPLMCH